MSIESEDFMDWADGAQRELEHELEQLRERGKEIQDYQLAIDTARQLVSEKEKLTCEIESLTQQLQEEKRLRAEQGRLVIRAVLVLRENLTAEQADKASELFSGRGMMRPGGMGAGGERHRSRRNGGEGRRGSSAPADKPAADK